jgi:ABC-type transporter Mla subunit MlaD
MLSVFHRPTITSAQTNPFAKGQVADRIRKVEDGVDEFQKYLNNRGDDAKDRADSAQNSGATSRRQRGDSTNAQNRRNQVNQTKDDLEDAMDDLNRSTNRLRRKFDPTSNYLETKVQMEQVMDSARRVNQVMTKGNYGTQAQRYWAALRANINDPCTVLQLDSHGDIERLHMARIEGSAQLSHVDDRAMLRVCNCPADDLVG